jgi:hypothetical protein
VAVGRTSLISPCSTSTGQETLAHDDHRSWLQSSTSACQQCPRTCVKAQRHNDKISQNNNTGKLHVQRPCSSQRPPQMERRCLQCGEKHNCVSTGFATGRDSPTATAASGGVGDQAATRGKNTKSRHAPRSYASLNSSNAGSMTTLCSVRCFQ